MPTATANEDSRLFLRPRVREFAVPPSVIETATARRLGRDWAGARAAAGIDVDLDRRSLTRTPGWGTYAAPCRTDRAVPWSGGRKRP